MANFTFKNHPKPKGLASVGHQGGGDIKYEKRNVGFFLKDKTYYSENNNWVMVLVVKSHPNEKNSTELKNVKVFEHENLDIAKQWMKENKKELLEKYVLVNHEDE